VVIFVQIFVENEKWKTLPSKCPLQTAVPLGEAARETTMLCSGCVYSVDALFVFNKPTLVLPSAVANTISFGRCAGQTNDDTGWCCRNLLQLRVYKKRVSRDRDLYE
jgi:hypothetical protein|tara:strand:+ start:615 stop:935 length:321 start_codon:yes stop_codon:yes gene_type:complete